MSEYLCKLVDFAKHGEGITSKQFNYCQEKLKNIRGENTPCWPDFQEKKPEETYESNSILGKIYRMVNTEEFFEDCIKKEHNFSIQYKYLVNNKLFKIFMGKKEHTLPILLKMYNLIVNPMTNELISLMSQHHLINEAEFFCTDGSFRHKMNKKSGVMIGDESKKDEDIML